MFVLSLTRTNIRSRMNVDKEGNIMEKILESANNNKVIILFVITVLLLTTYMGLGERKLANVSSNDSSILETK